MATSAWHIRVAQLGASAIDTAAESMVRRTLSEHSRPACTDALA